MKKIAFSAKPAFVDIRNFLAGRFMGATRDEFFLEEIIKLIFCKYEFGDRKTDSLGELELSTLYRDTFESVLTKYSDLYTEKNCQIELDPISIQFVDSKLNELDLDNIERDIIGDAYETFIGDAVKGQSGQFFTPQNATEALVRMVDPKPDQSVLDLTCGAGGFLVSTLRHWAKDGKVSQDMVRNLHGVDKDGYLVRLSKIHLACLAKSSFDIQCADSLVWDCKKLGNREEAYDIILTNPPFGANIQAGTQKTLSRFQLAYKYKRNRSGAIEKTNELNEAVPPQVVFMEQCIRLVKRGGLIGIVVPESMISSKKYSYVVEFIIRECVIKAVAGMPDELFKTSGKGGTHTKTCLLVLRRKTLEEDSNDGDIFMAEAKWCGHDSRGKEVPKDDIPQIVNNYLRFQESKKTPRNKLGFSIQLSSIENDVLAPRAYQQVENLNNFRSGSYHFVTIGDLVKQKCLQISTGDEVGKLAYGTGTIPFVRTSDISNWEIKSDPKHLLSDEIYESLAKKQDVQAGDILMVKDGSYLIGTCAMVSKYDTRIVFQSHLYKIRVLPNEYGFDCYYLLAALSSDYLKQQISSKTFSQDIINSLGDRLRDLIIPIPKNAKNSEKISDMVSRAINDSIEARELAKKARKEVFTL